jgi:hypothetical protein
MDTATLIRDLAARGHSRASVRDQLGYSRERFALTLEYLGPVNWPTPGRSLGNRQAMDARKGVRPAAGLRALENARAIRKEQASHTVRGYRGTINELVAYFKLSLNPQTVRRRMAEGQSLETALFTPIQQPSPGSRQRCALNK